MLDTSWGIFFLPIFIMLGATLYLIISYFVKAYREAAAPQPTTPTVIPDEMEELDESNL